jgi:hypothetical protein
VLVRGHPHVLRQQSDGAPSCTGGGVREDSSSQIRSSGFEARPAHLRDRARELGLPAQRTVYVAISSDTPVRAARMQFPLAPPGHAAPDQLSMRRLDELPALLASHFACPLRGSSASPPTERPPRAGG